MPMATHETFMVVRITGAITVLHELPQGAESLGEYNDLNRAIDTAKSRASQEGLDFIDPPDDLVGVA